MTQCAIAHNEVCWSSWVTRVLISVQKTVLWIFWITVFGSPCTTFQGASTTIILERKQIFFVNQKTYFLLNTGDNKLFFSVLLREHTDVLIYKSNLLLLLYSLSIGAAGRRIQSRSERELTASLCGKSATFLKHDSVCEPQTSSSTQCVLFWGKIQITFDEFVWL